MPFPKVMLSSKSTDTSGRASRILGGLAIPRHLFLQRGGEKKGICKAAGGWSRIEGIRRSLLKDTVQVRGVAMGGPVPPQVELNWDFFYFDK